MTIMDAKDVDELQLDRYFDELCYACRTGDVENADRLISTGVKINAVDRFDNSPLFLASLCGHENVVKLLLERGAICDRDRYEGARCIYGALTDSIRDILLAFDVSKAVDVNQPFGTHISSLLKDIDIDQDGLLKLTHDVIFQFTNSYNKDLTYISANKFLLVARSSFMEKQLNGTDCEDDNNENNGIITLPETINQACFEIILKFIYLIPVLHEINPNNFNDLIKLSNLFHIELLPEFLMKVQHMTDPTEKSTLMTEYQYEFTKIARRQLDLFVENRILRNYLVEDDLSEKLPKLKRRRNSTYSDVLVRASRAIINEGEEQNEETRFYPCHLAMLFRADYFKLMFLTPFQERTGYEMNKTRKTSNNTYGFESLPIISFPKVCKFEVIEIIIRYLYYDNTTIPWEFAIDILLMADYLLSDRLKTMAATSIIQSGEEFLSHYSIFEVLYIGWETRVEKLEQYTAKVIAQNIEQYCNDDKNRLQLKDAIKKSSERISERQEIDTIELVDDIKYYLLEKYGLEADDVEIFMEENDPGLLEASGVLAYQTDLDLFNELLKGLEIDV
ncbi:uncharacterized protein NDAI_0H02080 [Naumovozyma dairenensis CBS 421]|uniref:BTB domain-containing protein n=1 Tax=Naumovozyma dairenensis (strain ATCC 10597 / BCRC 20456 / CBS 421 / NBRC 0211 / NRRL Y-12639) TaxID=1071378 RepID=G0WF21_NAUDC|nr:hypothetical protein NDAI_0H02080 [Naumovozyma dairenensis CBS 421]CCD26382.1 hypothetical protein NDAI_0H02080 [Naumovozyma dairenensis CBS 421]